MQFPFVKPLLGKEKHFIYDANTNLLFRCPVRYWEAVQSGSIALKTPESNKQVEERDLCLLQKLGLFGPSRLLTRLTSPLFFDRHVERLYRYVGGLILSITERCNFRCRYCVYSGEYAHARARSHSGATMTSAVAAAALRYYARHLKSDADASIGFYGGEPLLNAHLIKECVNSWRAMTHPKKTRFAITTNGSLLDSETIDFLVANGFSVMVSLDGPESMHDANRVKPDGSGTFERVWRNLLRLRSQYPKFFREKILFSLTETAHTNYETLKDFIESYPEMFQGGCFVFSALRPGRTSSPSSEMDAAYASWQSYQRLKREYIASLKAGRRLRGPFWDSVFVPYFRSVHMRSFNALGEGDFLMPACVPGEQRVFVDVRGVLHMCEKVNTSMPLGDVFRGINRRIVSELYNSYYGLVNQERCRACWAVRFCPACYVTLSYWGALEPPREEWCSTVRRNIEERLSDYCEVIASNPRAFDFYHETWVDPPTPGYTFLAGGFSVEAAPSL